jgi:phospholipid N-methyltransferase
MKLEGGKEAWDFDPVAAISNPRSQAVAQPGAKAGAGIAGSKNTLQVYWRFLCAGLTRHTQTGALMPSQRVLIERMIAPVPADYRGEILELGAGTGVLTFRLAERCPEARILGCEINPDLADDLKARVAAAGLGRRVRITSEPAEQLLKRMAQRGAKAADFVISGIPLGNLVKKRAVSLIGAIHGALSPGGLYIQFQYSLMDRRKIKNRFSHLRTGFVLLNMPPAFIYYARR